MPEYKNLSSPPHLRSPGEDSLVAGEKKITETQPGLLTALEKLVAPVTRGNPESTLRWVSKSTYHLRDALQNQHYTMSQPQVGKLLDALDYSLQAPKKTEEGGNHPDRDVQFTYIYDLIAALHMCGGPTLSVDAKKKENIGNYANTGREYQKKGHPVSVKVYDFVDKSLGKVVPYGIYDIGRNEGFVNVGISANTAEFAVNSIRKWWYALGRTAYPYAPAWLITADGGGSNSSRSRLWKAELQRLANEVKLNISVCHDPPGTSKWNKIEHRMFSYITANWRGKPLTSRETVVNLIGDTTTTTGLRILAQLDEQTYEKGRAISDEEFAAINIERETFHGEWNYIIKPIRLS